MQLPASLSRHLSALRALAHQAREQSTSPHGNHKTLPNRLADVLVRTWDLGFTSFGGPAVHFQILHQRFVAGRGGKQKWVDEQTYQELFAICQGLPGPGSTKMIFCLALLHAGFIPALLVFLIWSLPGAVGMYALSLGVQRINETMPAPVYALLSGLNASTVGIIALAAVQLAEKAIRDKLTRILIILGACAGLCYNALWYFPLLMLLGGLATVVWDSWMSQKINRVRVKLKRRKENREGVAEETGAVESLPLEERITSQNGVQRRSATAGTSKSGHSVEALPHGTVGSVRPQPAMVANPSDHAIRVKVGIAIALVFFGTHLPRDLIRGSCTVIFGGGPVVIPLLRSYVVDPGWVSSRDFLLGLAIIQAFPGPNFNFAVYLGALALQRSQFPTVLGALLGFLGIFFPGITLAVAVQSFWRVLRTKKWVVDLLRGVNAAAVGLVFTAVYRLWEIGYLTSKVSQGQSLAMEPWWVVVAAVTYAESAWFNVPPALAIVIGAVLGLCWYGAVGR
ncbi:putative chromate ion transporter [Macrophomina phaseolina]|uniref:Chromate ion transporter n=1 Tax=Macrophomina phaseolina TaxID=35725 RepID=A0ABQ8G875_9PEZI|nr:putative chromate ion transporter [Macrophomina phaseolina]